MNLYFCFNLFLHVNMYIHLHVYTFPNRNIIFFYVFINVCINVCIIYAFNGITCLLGHLFYS